MEKDDGQLGESASGGLEGTVLAGRYRVAQVVSTGANTVLIDAIDLSNEGQVTVKVVRPEHAQDPEFRRKFRRLAEISHALTHPNIASVVDWGEIEIRGESTVFWVVDALGGGSLRDLLDRGRLLEPGQALVVGLEACRALDAAHQKGLFHTELTPSKMVFGADRRLRVVDFGMARLLAEPAWADASAVPTHVARYASPEQALGLPIDAKTDVYALALVMIEAVTGSVPFAADSTVATLAGRVDKLLPVSADLGSLASVLERAGRPESADRFTAAEFGRALVQAAPRLPKPEPIPILATGTFDTTAMRRPTDPTGGVERPAPVAGLAGVDESGAVRPPSADPSTEPISDEVSVVPPSDVAPSVVPPSDVPPSDVPPSDVSDTAVPAAEIASDEGASGDVAVTAAAGAAAVAAAAASGAIAPTNAPAEPQQPEPESATAEPAEPVAPVAPDAPATGTEAADGLASDAESPEGSVSDTASPESPESTVPGTGSPHAPVSDTEPSSEPPTQSPTEPPTGSPSQSPTEPIAVAAGVATTAVPVVTAPPTALPTEPAATTGELYDDEPRRRRRGPVIMLVVLLLAGLGALGYAGSLLMQTKSFEVPVLAGVPEDEALNQIAGNGWEIEVLRERSDSFPVLDTVIRTVPSAGVELDEGDPFTLVLSDGPEFRILPDLDGVPFDAAMAELAGLGLSGIEGPDREFSETVPTGSVISWQVQGDTDASLQAGSQILPGETVVMALSQGPEPRSVPDLSGLTVAEATAELDVLQLVLAQGEAVFSDSVAVDAIVSQTPAVGESLDRDGTVTVQVSKGPDRIPFPDLEGLTFTEAQDLLRETGFTVGTLLGTTEGTFVEATIDGVDLQPGDRLRRGRAIDLIFL